MNYFVTKKPNFLLGDRSAEVHGCAHWHCTRHWLHRCEVQSKWLVSCYVTQSKGYVLLIWPLLLELIWSSFELLNHADFINILSTAPYFTGHFLITLDTFPWPRMQWISDIRLLQLHATFASQCGWSKLWYCFLWLFCQFPIPLWQSQCSSDSVT